MANFYGLNRRLDKIQESLPRRDTTLFEWDYSLFTPVEQAELQIFIESFPDKLCETNKLSGEQLTQFSCWVRLYVALQNGNMVEAEKWRRRRAMSLEQLVDRFLSLDISSIPDGNDPGIQVKDDNCIYSLRQTNYRCLQWSVTRDDRRYAGQSRNEMWIWIEYLEQH